MRNKPDLIKGFFFGIGLAALIVASIFGWPYIQKLFNTPEKKIISLNADNLYLLEHDFVYAVTLDIEGSKNTIYMVKDANNQFDIWEPGQTANRIYATALMIDSTGDCITSNYAIAPWTNRYDYKLLSGLLEKEFDLQEDQIMLKGLSIRMALKKFDQSKNDSSEIQYRPMGYSPVSNMQVAFISKADSAKIFYSKNVSFADTINENKETVYLLSSSGLKKEISFPLRASVTRLERNSIQSDNDLASKQYYTFKLNKEWLPEGAPVFNSKAELIGIYSGYNNKSDSSNNIMSIPQGKLTTEELAEDLRQLKEKAPDGSFIFLNKNNNGGASLTKEWQTIVELDNNSTDQSTAISGEELWTSPATTINGENARLNIIIDKLEKNDDYTNVFKIRILHKDSDGIFSEETYSIQYDSEGTFTENLWKFDGDYKIEADGMQGCVFKIELQAK